MRRNEVTHFSTLICSCSGWPASTSSSRCPTARWRDLSGSSLFSFQVSDLQTIPCFSIESRNKNSLLNVSTPNPSHEVIVVVGSAGIKVTNRWEWIREKWRIRRGWIKVHPMIDIETDQILGLEVTDESVQDNFLLTLLLDQVSENCWKAHPNCLVLGDGAYDRIHVFNTLEKRGIKSGIKRQENAATRSTRVSPSH